jgi:hypothetical protein
MLLISPVLPPCPYPYQNLLSVTDLHGFRTSIAQTMLELDRFSDRLFQRSIKRSFSSKSHPQVVQKAQSWAVISNFLNFLLPTYDYYVRTFSSHHPATIRCHRVVAGVLYEHDFVLEAENAFCSILEGNCRVFGHSHPETLETMFQLGEFLWEQDRFDASIALFESLLTLAEERYSSKGIGPHLILQRYIIHLSELYEELTQRGCIFIYEIYKQFSLRATPQIYCASFDHPHVRSPQTSTKHMLSHSYDLSDDIAHVSNTTSAGISASSVYQEIYRTISETYKKEGRHHRTSDRIAELRARLPPASPCK